MNGQIFVLKRSNGFVGIYVNGKQQSNLTNNFPADMKSEYLFDMVKLELKNQANKGIICDVIFTDEEESFKSNLPKLESFIENLK